MSTLCIVKLSNGIPYISISNYCLFSMYVYYLQCLPYLIFNLANNKSQKYKGKLPISDITAE